MFSINYILTLHTKKILCEGKIYKSVIFDQRKKHKSFVVYMLNIFDSVKLLQMIDLIKEHHLNMKCTF